MWHIEKISKETLNWYKDTFLDKVFKDIHDPKSKICPVVLRELTLNVIEHLLIDEPKDLYEEAKAIEDKLISKKLWDSQCERLFKAFNYDKNISENKANSYALAERIGTKTCVYCNRIYAFTVIDKIGKDGKQLDDKHSHKIVRPDFDHWLSKAEHPLTSMSIYNLIPSCPVCNRGIKLQREFTYGVHVHPYDSDSDPSFSFRYSKDAGSGWDLKICGGTDAELKTAKLLETEAIYKVHANMEVKDILDFLYRNTPEYLDELYNKVLGAYGNTISVEDAYKFMFGAESAPAKFLDRPLSKLKHDIIQQAAEDLGLKHILKVGSINS